MLFRWTSKVLNAFSKESKLRPNKKLNMEVTKNNFAEKLPLIEAAIDDADFISIDGEFTGLNLAATRHSALDTPVEVYGKTRKSCDNFLLVQFGLCTFHYDKKRDKYTNRAFNFYVWPRPYSR